MCAGMMTNSVSAYSRSCGIAERDGRMSNVSRGARFATRLNTLQLGVRHGHCDPVANDADRRAADRHVNQNDARAVWIFNGITSETESSTHYFWSVARNVALDVDEMTEAKQGCGSAGMNEGRWKRAMFARSRNPIDLRRRWHGGHSTPDACSSRWMCLRMCRGLHKDLCNDPT